MKTYSLADFGIVSDGTSLLTADFQRAIDAISLQGGGSLWIPKGEYVLSTVFLRSNVKLLLDKEAKLLGSLNFNDYRPDEVVDYPLYQDASHSFFECSMFVGLGVENISIVGGEIDMRSVWDEENKRNMAHRGAKAIALKECKNVKLSGIKILNATDLAVYFAGCDNVEIANLWLSVYIDGISPDNSTHVDIHDCFVEAGDDAIVLKSSYTLNRLGECKDINVYHCTLTSRCNAIKIGTETNGAFRNITFSDIEIYNTRLAGIALESVDGATIEGVRISNIRMINVNGPFFIMLGNRLRGPEGLKIGAIRDVSFYDIHVHGKYVPYETIPWNYASFKANDRKQRLWIKDSQSKNEENMGGNQFTSMLMGLKDHPLENIRLKQVHLHLDGGVQSYSSEVTDEPKKYPEIYAYGSTLPALGLYARHIRGLVMDDVSVVSKKEDTRPAFVLEDVRK